jgi:hypothetical protein
MGITELIAMVTAGHALAMSGTLDVPPQFEEDPRRPYGFIAVNKAGERVLDAMREIAPPMLSKQDWDQATTILVAAIENGLAEALTAHGLTGD